MLMPNRIWFAPDACYLVSTWLRAAMPVYMAFCMLTKAYRVQLGSKPHAQIKQASCDA